MEKKLASVLRYFAIFDYFPKFEDVYTFFPTKISKKSLKKLYETYKYTLPEYSSIPGFIPSKAKNLAKRKISKRKLNGWRFKTYIWLLSLLPQIKLVGLSGSIAMMNADSDDDIDLFIITSKNRLFTARFLVTIIAFIMGLKRALGQHKAANKVCLNLFFDESDLKVPKFKQTVFVGHEILQMRPIINKSQTYDKFLYANRWVLSFFPNATINSKIKVQNKKLQLYIQNCQFLTSLFNLSFLILNFIELVLKKMQMFMINRHRTTEIITNTQLWFHPDDFERKIRL